MPVVSVPEEPRLRCHGKGRMTKIGPGLSPSTEPFVPISYTLRRTLKSDLLLKSAREGRWVFIQFLHV
ncbi:hypothetical protein PRUPE_1G537800 [Prunus persica]|uniref:Uncharacterized protein n=1 Tax=Prunus persica TaxID=3760 RepID=M5XGW8_PRUPE|nr:hypothetical protein PRUPE_1G537800 [Prunus persica]